MTRVKWLGNVTLGKLGSIYGGETPSAISAFSVGVRPRSRKSARNPSREINMVVGPKRAEPLESRCWEECEARKPLEALYAPSRNIRNKTKTAAKTSANLVPEIRRG